MNSSYLLIIQYICRNFKGIGDSSTFFLKRFSNICFQPYRLIAAASGTSRRAEPNGYSAETRSFLPGIPASGKSAKGESNRKNTGKNCESIRAGIEDSVIMCLHFKQTLITGIMTTDAAIETLKISLYLYKKFKSVIFL